MFPSSTSAAEASTPSSSGVPHLKPHQVVQTLALQGQVMQHNLPEHILRPVATPAYRAALSPNPFKEKVSPDSSLSSGPPQSATTVSFSTMTSVDAIGKITQNAGKLVVLPPRPVANSRKKCTGKSDENGATCAILGRCHCSKRRYNWIRANVMACTSLCTM